MRILTGLFEHMVLQRNASNVCCQKIEGVSDCVGTVFVTVSDEKDALLLESELGNVEDDKTFAVYLRGIPCGGPYNIKLVINSENESRREELNVSDVLVGDVWMLAGQSNMQGVGNLCDALAPHQMIRSYYMDDRWDIADEPVHNMQYASAQIHWTINGLDRDVAKKAPVKGVCPAMGFGYKMYETTGVPQGFIASAHGGTSMAQWSPELADKGDDSLYGAMLNRFKRNGSQLKGLLWYQGCSDAGVDVAPLYYDRMAKFIRAVRDDFNFHQMPFVLVQISRVAGRTNDTIANKMWSKIREDQRKLALNIPKVATIPAIDLDLDDVIHISGKEQHRLGRRMAEAYLTMTKYPGALPPPIELDKITAERDEKHGEMLINIFFRNVVGRLTSGISRATGFSILSGNRTMLSAFRTELAGDKVVLHVGDLNFNVIRIAYAYGTDPYVNITDEADRSLPAFGPERCILGAGTVMTPFASNVVVSAPLYGDDSAEALKYPENLNSLVFKPTVSSAFFVYPEDLNTISKDKCIRYFRTKYDFPADMNTRILLGYDGPVKMYLDGVEIYSDVNGVNPIIPDQGVAERHIEKGIHEIIVAFNPRGGHSWGISLRLTDIDKKYSNDTDADSVLEDTMPEEVEA